MSKSSNNKKQNPASQASPASTTTLAGKKARRGAADVSGESKPNNNQSNKRPALPTSICKVLRVHDQDDRFSGKLLIRIEEPGTPARNELLDLAPLARGNTDALADLCIKYDWLEDMTRAALNALAKNLRFAAEGTSVRVLQGDGFHRPIIDDERYGAFVWRKKILWVDEKPAARFAVHTAMPLVCAASGTLEDWNNEIGCHLAANPVMLVAVCAGLVGPLVPLLGLASVSLILVGGSTTGKSTLQAVVQSMVQPGDDIASASGTVLGLRQLLLQCRDRPALLQDLHQFGDVKALGSLLFDLANNANRATSTAEHTLSTTGTLRCSFIGSSERSIADMIRGGRVSSDEGLSARVFEIAVNGPHGVFHRLPAGLSASEFADRLKSASAAHYGAMWDAWTAMVCENGTRIREGHADKFDKLHAELMTHVNGENRVNRRLVQGLAGWAFAGCVAATLKLLPITSGQVVSAFKHVLDDYTRRHANGLSATGEEVIEHVRGFLDQNAGGFLKLTTQDFSAQGTHLGYRREVKGETQYMFLTAAFDKHIVKKFGRDLAVKALRDAGYLISDAQGDQKNIRLANGKRKRFYVISAAIRYVRK